MTHAAASPLPASPHATIACEKCRGPMVPARLRRFSPALVAIGYTLWIPAVLILLAATGCGLLVVGGSATATTELLAQAEQTAVAELRAIDGLPATVVSEFTDTRRVSDAAMGELTPAQRAQVETVVRAYDASLVGGGIGSSVAMGGSVLVIALIYVVAIPFLIVGLVLTLRKNVWRCGQCAYVFDRA